MSRNYPAAPDGAAANTILAPVGSNFLLLLARLAALLCLFPPAPAEPKITRSKPNRWRYQQAICFSAALVVQAMRPTGAAAWPAGVAGRKV